MFIITEDMTNYIPVYPDTLTLIGTYFEGLLFNLRQLSLSPDAYAYYRDAEKQLEAEGRLFDPAYVQPSGNIECISDPERKVIGVFSASDVNECFVYMYVNYNGRTYTNRIDSFPELWLDTCSYGMPDSWIKPPF
jgi:hypothetical protein